MTKSIDTQRESQLTKAITLIDEINKQDPNSVVINGASIQVELVYGQRMTNVLENFIPDAPLSLSIACRAQHIKRWAILRADYPMGRTGYLTWRKDLGAMHADLAMDVAKKVGCDEDEVAAVGQMLRKEQLKREPLVQALEDVACLVFLTYYLTPFCEKYTPEKIISIVQKTWKKMSEAGHEAALKLPFTPAQTQLLTKALS